MSQQFKVKFKEVEYPAEYIRIRSDARYALKHISTEHLIGLDTETMALKEYHHIPKAALDPHISTIRLLQLFDGRKSYVFDMLYLRHDVDDEIRQLLEAGRFIAHNAVFDLKFLRTRFKPKKTIDIGCSMLAFHLIEHAGSPGPYHKWINLRELVEVAFDEKVFKENQVSDWSVPELNFEQIEYSALDPILVLRCAERLAPAMKRHDLFDFYDLSKHAQHAIADMELNGIQFDATSHLELVAGWRDKLYEAKKALMQATGLKEVTGPKMAEWFEEHLPVDLVDIWPRTDSGKLSTDAITLSDMAGTFSEMPLFSAFQKWKTLTSDFGGKMIQQVNPATKRVHPKYSLIGTRTGRLSCNSPNLQQAPREKAFRAEFVPAKGCVFVGADYSMIELRVAAEVSRDKTMLKAFRDGKDLHTVMVEAITGQLWEAIPKEQQSTIRRVAKNVNFGCLYGMGAKKFASYARKSSPDSPVTEENASQYVQTFRDTYKGYRKWHVDLYSEALQTLEVRTRCGKKRCLCPEICYGAAPNTIVQGSAAGCMLWSMVFLYEAIHEKCLPAKLIATIHDELILECKTKHAETVKTALEDCMTRGFLAVFPKGTTRGIVEAKVGNNWVELK